MKVLVSILSITLFAIVLGPVAAQPPAEVNASANDRKEVADQIRKAILADADKLKLEDRAEERHREVVTVGIGPLKKDIVTYWWSDVSGNCVLVEPQTKFTLDVSKMIRGENRTKFTVVASCPGKGSVSGTAKSDDKKVTFVTINSDYTCTLNLSMDCVLTREIVNDKVVYKLETTKAEPKLTDLKFGNALDRIGGDIQKLANEKLAKQADKMCETANAALKTAYEEGRLKFTK